MKHAPLVSLALTALVLACSSTKAPAPIANTGPADGPPSRAAEDGMTDGALWTCQIDDYDPQPCKLTKAGDQWSLTKLMGSQRFRGTITWDDPDTARFVGTYFCPWGACDEAMDVTFKRDAGTYRADFGGGITARYDRALADEWGGAGYGGLTGDEQ